MEEPIFYGIPISIPGIIPLLDLKLDIETREEEDPTETPCLRNRDINDIFDLISVYVTKGSIEGSINTLYKELSSKNLIRLEKILKENQLELTLDKYITTKPAYEHVKNRTKIFIDVFKERNLYD